MIGVMMTQRERGPKRRPGSKRAIPFFDLDDSDLYARARYHSGHATRRHCSVVRGYMHMVCIKQHAAYTNRIVSHSYDKPEKARQ